MKMTTDGEPILSVHVENPEDLRVLKTEEVEPEHFVFQTIVVGTGAGLDLYRPALALDPDRKEAYIFSVDSPVVICHSQAQANAVSNQVALVPFPEGFYLGAGQGLPIKGTGRVWIAATAPTASRVSIAINRRSSA